jgi:hypothetical protein
MVEQNCAAAPKRIHAFEFSECSSLPRALSLVLRDTLVTMLSAPFRGYNETVCTQIANLMRTNKLSRLIELGAGSAPICTTVARSGGEEFEYCPSDLVPDQRLYADYERRFGPRFRPVGKAVDMRNPKEWEALAGPHSLVVISGSFHHLTTDERLALLRELIGRRIYFLIAEPFLGDIAGYLLGSLSFFPALLHPLRFLFSQGTLKRIFWSWIIPAAPVISCWDAVVSNARQWNQAEWHAVLALLAVDLRGYAVEVVATGQTFIAAFSPR